MAAAKLFKRGYSAAMTAAELKVSAIRSALDFDLERMAVNAFGAPDPAKEPHFAPPATPVRVHCWHCGGKYLSDKMRLEYRPRMQAVGVENLGQGFVALEPLWWCKNDTCDGAGFGHDIHITKASKKPGAS